MGESIKTLGYEVREWQESRVYKTVTRDAGQCARRIRKQNNNKLRPFEESCSETVVPRSGEPKQLDQTEVLVKHARFH